jgi:hypothetical protein
MNEIYLVDTVSNYLNVKSFQTIKELPFLQRRIDIVGYQLKKDALIAVEAKVKNWQDAVKQAITCLLFADEVYIAMPSEYIHRVDQSELHKFGIGLLGVNSSVHVVYKAVSSRYTSTYHRKKVIDRLQWLETVQVKGYKDVSN